MTAIVAGGVGKWYAWRWALRNCAISIPAGSVVGLVGANGAGKTTFLHLAGGLLQPTDRTIAVLGERPGIGPRQLVPHPPTSTWCGSS